MTNPREQLADIVKDHYWDYSCCGGWSNCACGEANDLTSDTYAGHLTDAIIQAGWTPPPTPAHNTLTHN